MTGVEEVEVMTGIKGMINDVRKERKASLQRRLHEVNLGRGHKSTGTLNLCS